jgi:putative hydrolase of the HAD superfamily
LVERDATSADGGVWVIGERSALLVDFGGAVTTNVHDSFRAFSTQISGDPTSCSDCSLAILNRRGCWSENECGRLDDESFEEGFAKRLAERGVSVAPRGLLKGLLAGCSVDHEMLDVVRRLRLNGVPVALVTNQFGRDCYAGFDLDELADIAVVSAEVGVRKPSRRIFATACERLAVTPDACVLVDDVELNLAGAVRLGIAGVLHTSAARTARELDERFGIGAAA